MVELFIYWMLRLSAVSSMNTKIYVTGFATTCLIEKSRFEQMLTSEFSLVCHFVQQANGTGHLRSFHIASSILCKIHVIIIC